MDFQLNNKDKQQLEQLFATLAVNISASEVALDLIDGFENLDLVDVFKHCKTTKCFHQQIKDLYGFDHKDPFQVQLFENHLLPSIKKIDLAPYTRNPYYQTIKNHEYMGHNLELISKQYRKNQLFIYDDVINVGPYFQERLSLGYTPKPFPYLALVENQHIWMAIIPHEIRTMEAAVLEAKGRVLVLGLGLGYYPFMISAKDEVTSIVIVEKDAKIIEIFNEYLLPQFPHAHKITTIQADAYDYMRAHHHQFDYAFFDIYRNGHDDIELYVKAKRQQGLYPNLNITYWLENSMISYLRRIIIAYIEERYYHYVVEEESEIDDLIAHLATHLDDLVITSYQDIQALLTKDNIIKMIC